MRYGVVVAVRDSRQTEHQGDVAKLGSPYSNADGNGAKRRRFAALGEFGTRFLNGQRLSVNPNVQDSNPCPGANFRIYICRVSLCWRWRPKATVQQLFSERETTSATPGPLFELRPGTVSP